MRKEKSPIPSHPRKEGRQNGREGKSEISPEQEAEVEEKK
jgi:hypothetical protein